MFTNQCFQKITKKANLLLRLTAILSITFPTIVNGTAIITVAGLDLVGNAYAGGDTYTVKIDNTATISIASLSWGPSLNLTESGMDGTIFLTTTGVEDNQVVSVGLNSQTYTGTVTNNEASITISSAALTALTDGVTYTVTANVSDAAGNAATQASTSFTVDITSPTISIASLSWGPSLNLTES
ncbi:MAG: Ig-like domain-containing protein, partial [Sediminibacterium sp.]